MTAGKASPLSVKTAMEVLLPGRSGGCVPERLHLFSREEGCRGRHGEAAIVTLCRDPQEQP